MYGAIMNQDHLPEGIQLTPLDDNFREDPYPVLRKLQSTVAVHHDTQLNRYFYTHHDDVRDILRDKDFWSDPRKANPGTFTRHFLGDLEENGEPSMLMMDEPGHRRLRALVSRPFTPNAVEKWRDRTREVVARVLADIKGDEFDLIKEFAGPIPTVVIAEMLGIDASMHAQFKNWSDLSVKIAFNPFPSEQEVDEGEAARNALVEFFEAEIQRRRQNLGDDLISDMIRAEEAGDSLSQDEIVRQCNLLLVAGNVTTTDLIGNGVKALLEHPDQLQRLKAEPELIKNAVEEILRFDSPVVNSGRIANRTINLGECPVHQGESLSVSLAAANRDPAVYPDPDRFDITREDTHHQAFGGGRHLCLGAHLARLEAQEALLALFERFPDLQPSAKGYQYAAIPSFRGLAEYWVNTGQS